MANSLPFLSDLSLSVTLDEEAVNLAPQLIDADVTFFDSNNNFDGGTLVLSGLLSEDIAAIRNEGTNAGEIGINGTDVAYGGVVIGTVSGGTGGVALSVTFNAQSTSASIEALIENLTYQNLSDAPVFARALELTITDAAGAQAVTPVVMQEAVGAANPFNGFDVGLQSAPSFADLDGDGDLDAVMGEFNGTLKYFENTGTGVVPAYVERTGAANPFNGIDVGLQSTPSFADLDRDGDLDAVSGEQLGTLKYFENAGTGVAPAYVEQTGAANPFNGIDVGARNALSFADLDGDGDLDAVIGEGDNGTLKYFENTGTGAAPAYVERTGAANPLNSVDVTYYAAPAFADLDGDGDLDAVIGGHYGKLNYFENTGTSVAPVYVARTGTANPLNAIDVGFKSRPSFADLDGDGDLDAVIGDDYGTLRYFENTHLRSAPGDAEFTVRSGAASPFNGIDVGLFSAPSVADLDGDGDLDAVSGAFDGTLKYFENTGSGVAPAYVELTGAANPFNGIDVGSTSAPAFADLDGDGDLDAVSGELYGTLKYFENTATGAAPAYVELTGAANPFNGIDVGSYSPLSFADLDGDGDLDAVVGENDGNLNYYENTGTGAAPAYLERTGAANPFNGVDVGFSSTPGFADLDGDGDLDALIGEYDGNLNFYENTGTGVAPAYVERTGVANPFNGVDVGRQSYPGFADLDGDGDLDAVIGEYDGNLNYYENAGAGAAPVYVDQTGAANPFNGIDVGYFSAPSFADLDGDGDLDAVSGENAGTLKYFENTGTGVAPAYVEQTGAANPFNGIDVGARNTPSFADLDGDGDLDAVIGESDNGTLKYFENTGTGVAPAYIERTGAANPLNSVDVTYYSAPAFADLDGDGDLDAVIGGHYGTLNYFENTGTDVTPVYVARTGVSNPFSGIDVGFKSRPSFADLDGDGDLDAVIGEDLGTLKYFENTGTGVAPAYVERTGTANPFNGIDVGNLSSPSFADLDGDGDLDAVIGETDGNLNYYENTGLGGFKFVLMVTQHADPSEGADVMNGTDGADSIDALGGNDTLIGGAGNDNLVGGAGNDSLLGGGGNDTLEGGANSDFMDGGDGDDVMTDSGDGAVMIGGEGNDLMIAGAFNQQLAGDNGNDTLVGGDGDNYLYGFNGEDSLVGGLGSDTLDGESGNDTLDGGADNDTLDGGVGNDSLMGGLGADNALGNAGIDTLIGNAGNDTLDGGADADLIYGSTNDDSILGGAGIDTLVGNAGNDTINGGTEDDQVFGSIGDDYVLGGLGADVVQGNAGNDTVIGGDGTGTDTADGNDSLDGGGGDDSLFGGFGADLELGNAGIDTLIGNAGNDTLDGGADGDLAYGSAGDDSILGSAGIDTLVGNANNDTIDGGADDDQVFGSIGDDLVLGGLGADVVSGNAGDDTVVGGAGNDTLQGNNGTDTFRYDAASLNTGDVAAGQADFVTATAAGDLISMLGLNDELTIAGTALSALTANAVVSNTLNATNNIAFTGGVLQIDLDGNDTFNALNDFQVQLTGVTSVTYNATSDLFQLA